MVVLNFHETNKQNESKNSIQSHIGKQIFYFGIFNFFTVDSNLIFHLNSKFLLSSILLFGRISLFHIPYSCLTFLIMFILLLSYLSCHGFFHLPTYFLDYFLRLFIKYLLFH